MQLHHTSTVPPAARPVRFNRRGQPPFAAVPIDDTTSVLVESAAEARDMVARFAQAAEFLESMEPPAPPVLRAVQEAPVCAKCGDHEFVTDKSGQWLCWETARCAARAERNHAEVTA